VFEFGAMSIANYTVLNVGRKIAVEWAVAGFVEALISGVVMGLVYKPALVAKTVRA